MSELIEIEKNKLPFDPFVLKNKWMLISASKDGMVNTMTASWGGFGTMWTKEVAFVVIRPQRYTKEFVDASDSFSLSFFDDSHKKDLSYLGKVSGRNEDKLAKTSLTVLCENDTPYFKEAETVIIVKKLYVQPMDGQYLLEKEIGDRWYPEKDYHYLYIGEVTNILHKTEK